MQNRFPLLLAVMLAIAGLLGVRPMQIAACSCAMPNPIEAQARADVVFVGAVAATRPHEAVGAFGQQVAYLFAVEEIRKGPPAASIVVTSSSSGASCGAGFAADTRWLVYATRAADGVYTSHLCEPNQLLGESVDVPDDAAEWPDEAAATPDANTGIPLQMVVMVSVIVGLALFSGLAFLWRGRSSPG